MNITKEPVSIRLDSDIKKQMEEIAKQNRTTFAHEMRQAAISHIKQKKS